MSPVDREVALEALSALTGATVKPYNGSKGVWNQDELNIYNFISAALLGQEILKLMSATGDARATLRYLDRHLSDSFFQPGATSSLSSGLRKELFVDMDEFFHPKYDYDFTNLSDHSVCMRGNEPYKRPCGWNRIALKVLGQYPDGDAWLGKNGWRSYSVAGEWPVSYHGTSIEGAKGIVTSHYKAGHGQLYGRGIYSTYDVDQASGYSKEFTSKKTGKTYRVIMQNRINPQMRKVCARKDYWLIEVPEGTSSAKEKEIVEKSIRPYGILLKEV